jgi:hypothetical protein
MEGFLHTDPEQLLEEHCQLLFSDFAALAFGPTKDKLEWIFEIDSALGAASHVAQGTGSHPSWRSLYHLGFFSGTFLHVRRLV